MMNTPTQTPRDYRLAIGLLAGAAIGACLTLWLAPRAADEIRGRIKDSARNLGKRAADQYDQASSRVGDAVDELARTGQGLRDHVADSVARGAHQVEGFAKAAKSA
jgi:gas vesicle protein